MRKSRIRSKLSAGQPALITTLHFIDPAVYEMTSLMGFDGIWMDLEHHGTSLETASNLMRASRVGMSDIIARPAKGEFQRMQRMLEVGAAGLMYPQCDSASEAQKLVHWTKFPPVGRRGCDAANADSEYMAHPLDEYLQNANQETLLVVQIENPEALEQVEDIAQVSGVDVLFLGPGDLSIRMGIAGELQHPRMLEAKQRVAAAARSANIHWGLPVASPEEAAAAIELGARFICHNADIILLRAGLTQIKQSFGSLGFDFE